MYMQFICIIGTTSGTCEGCIAGNAVATLVGSVQCHLPHVYKFELHSLSEKGLAAQSRNMAGCFDASIAFPFNFHSGPLGNVINGYI
jgi:hypothetical protein